jgi:hypothetical protein
MNSNPQNPYFNLDTARKYLEFAIQFTPQYGDSFLEMLKLTMLQNEEGMIKNDLYE